MRLIKTIPRSRHQLVVLSIALLASALWGCAKPNSPAGIASPSAPPPPVTYEENARPTLTLPENNSDNYVPPVSTIVNAHQNQRITLGLLQLQNARVFYSSTEKKMTVTGTATLVNEEGDRLAEKSFYLLGTHQATESQFRLSDQAVSLESAESVGNEMVLRAEAHCLSTTETDLPDCSHVVVTVVARYQNGFYSEQVEVNRLQSYTQPTEPEAPPEDLDQSADQDQADTDLQAEGDDDSIGGRYEAPIENINLDELFADAPAPSTPPPPATPAPSTPPPPSTPAPSTPPPPATPAPSTPPPPSTPAPRTPPPSTPAPDTPPPENNGGGAEIRISADLFQTRDGTVRQHNQASGFPNEGRLRNSTSLLTKQEALARRAYFEVVAPGRERHYCTYEMAEMIVRSGNLLNQRFTKKLFLSSASSRSGGRLRPHASHQMGTDIDIGYPSDIEGMKFPLVVNKRTREYFPRNYSVPKTYELFKFMFSQADIKVDRIFTDDKIKEALCAHAKTTGDLTGPNREQIQLMFENLQHVRGHGDHFHLRLKCSRLDPSCRSRVYRRMDRCT